MNEHSDEDAVWPSVEEEAAATAQAQALRNQAAEGGLRFEAYLPAELAEWLLNLVEKGTFLDPSEAVFVMMQEFRELGEHPDLRKELLKRRIQKSLDDPRPSVPEEEVFAKLKAMMTKPRPEPAVWGRPSRDKHET